MDNRNNRNFGNGKTLNRFTIRNLSRETAELANRGDALALKAQSGLVDLADHLKSEFEIKYLEQVEAEHLISWAENLSERLAEGELSSSTTSSYVSAVNTVFATHDRADLKMSAHEHGIARGSKYSNENLANSPVSQQSFQNWCATQAAKTGDIRYAALRHSVQLQIDAGLRFRESAQIKIASKHLSGEQIGLVRGDGVKNGQPRTFSPITMVSLRDAQAFVKGNSDIFSKKSMIPAAMTYREYKGWAYRELARFRSQNPEHARYHFHGNRHSFAHNRYEAAWQEKTGIGIQAPVVSGLHGKGHLHDIAEKTGISERDAAAMNKVINLEVAELLGHHRVDSGYAYNGV